MKRGFAFVIFAAILSLNGLCQDKIKAVADLLHDEKYAAAMQAIKSMYASDSNKAEYYFYAGEVNRHLSNYDVAISYYNKAIAVNPKADLAMNSEGIAYALKNDSIQALAWVAKALAIDPDNEYLYNTRAAIYMRTNNFVKALPDLLKCVALTPNDYIANYNLGSTYRGMEDYNDAIVYLTKSIKLNKDRRTYYERGLSYYYLDKNKDAIKDYTAALATPASADKYDALSDGEIYYWRAEAWKDAEDGYNYRQDLQRAKDNGYKIPDDEQVTNEVDFSIKPEKK